MSSIYLDSEYLDHFDVIAQDAMSDLFSLKSSNIFSLKQLFCALPVFTNMPNSDIRRAYLTKQTSSTKYSTLLLKSIIKNGRLFKCNSEILHELNYGGFYFLKKDHKELTSNYCIIAKDSTFNGLDYFNKYTISDLEIENKWDGIKDIFAPCSCMVIVDKYIFGTPFNTKLEALYTFIQSQKRPLKVPFHLSILTAYEKSGKEITNSNLVSSAFKKLSEIPNIEVEIIISNKHDIDDRLVFTDYTSANIGHPFDGRKTRYNQKFLGVANESKQIVENYKVYQNQISRIEDIFENVIPQIGLIQYKWPIAGIKNRLFSIHKMERV